MTNGTDQRYFYPESLLPHIKSRWHKTGWPGAKRKRPPHDSHVLKLLNVAFQASLSSQERRFVRFRIAYCDPADLLKDDSSKRMKWITRNRPIKFSKSRKLSVSEIVQLAPATDPRQFLIGVKAKAKDKRDDSNQPLEIWGLIDAGHSWWEFIRGERMGSLGGIPPPDCLILSVMSPGSLIISRSDETIVSLEKGELIFPMPDVFNVGPVGEYLDEMCRDFHLDVCKHIGSDKYDPDDEDEDYPQRFLREFIERVLLRIRDRRHGGTLLIVPDEWSISDSRLRDRVDIKYPIMDKGIWPLLVDHISLHRKYYDKLLPAWDAKKVSGKLFSEIQILERDYRETEDLVRDRANLLASLANIDGSVVLTTKLCLLGFGAEVIAQSPTLQQIKLANDSISSSGNFCPITDYGTRHRSALRFCSSHEGVLAFIVSQDGAIRVVKRVGADVVLWSGIVEESAD